MILRSVPGAMAYRRTREILSKFGLRVLPIFNAVVAVADILEVGHAGAGVKICCVGGVECFYRTGMCGFLVRVLYRADVQDHSDLVTTHQLLRASTTAV
jgi:hypothetical protein